MTTKGPKRAIWVMEMFYIVMVVVPQVYTIIKTQEDIYI